MEKNGSMKIELQKVNCISIRFRYPAMQETTDTTELTENKEYYVELLVLSLPGRDNHGEVKFFHPDVQEWYPMVGKYLGTYKED